MASAAIADCQGEFIGPSSAHLGGYDPLAAIDQRLSASVTLRNTGAEACIFRVYFLRQPAEGQFGLSIRYSLIDHNGAALFHGGEEISRFANALTTPALPPGAAVTVLFHALIARGQEALPGAYEDHFMVVLRSQADDDGEEEDLDQRTHQLFLQVPSVASLSIAGGGISTSVDFGLLEEGKSRRVVLQARANNSYRITFSSKNQGRLKLTPGVPGQQWYVPYTLSVDDTHVDLTQPFTLQNDSGSIWSSQSQDLLFTITETKNKRAGIYEDIITAAITPIY